MNPSKSGEFFWNTDGKIKKIEVKVLTCGGICYWNIDKEILAKNSISDALVKGLLHPTEYNLKYIKLTMKLYLAFPNEMFYLGNRKPLGGYTSPDYYKDIIKDALQILNKEGSVKDKIQKVIPRFWD